MTITKQCRFNVIMDVPIYTCIITLCVHSFNKPSVIGQKFDIWLWNWNFINQWKEQPFNHTHFQRKCGKL